jgi:acetyl-CoA C-acetyltransferase
MARQAKAYIAGVYEHPTRKAVDKTLAQLHAEVARGALADAGLTKDDVDGFFCDGSVPGLGGMVLAEYMGLNLSHTDTTETGGSSYLVPYGPMVTNLYAMAAMRHMHEFGTTSEQLAWIKVAASHHAQHNPHAMLRDVVSVEDVLASPMICDPLHRLDCCVISDGGGALVVVSPEIAATLGDRCVKVLGQGEAIKHLNAGQVDLTYTGAALSGPVAFAEAGLKPADMDYVSIYDSFTITVLETLEDLGFCAKGKGGAFVSDGNLISGVGKLPFNTDGGGLCNNHPSNRGGMTKVIEAVRQLRHEAHPAVQVPDCRLALAHGTGGQISQRTGAATIILGGNDA